MKRKVIKNIILLVLTTSTVLSLNSTSVQAAWKKDSQNKWNWIENGVKATGWKLIGGSWYYFYSNGTMATGWVKNGGKWYYLKSSGEMATGWNLIDGSWYLLYADGAMATGWAKNGGKWYYLKPSGAMVTGWLELDGKKYYLSSSGAMVTGKVTIGGKEYNFSDSGALIVNSSTNTPASGQTGERRKAYVVTQSSSLNMRKEPSVNSQIIGYLPKHSEIVVIGKEINGFYKVEYNNKIGYASSQWISFTKPATGNTNITLGPIRTTGPETGNKYYYSNSNIFYQAKLCPPFTNSSGNKIIGNCTWYAYGRIGEMTGHMPYDAGFTGNAYEWWNANLRTGKYKYGNTPKVGALAVWKSSLPNSGGCGHVAIVEKIENGRVYISESSWHGSYFRYRQIYDTSYLYGYIYIDQPNF